MAHISVYIANSLMFSSPEADVSALSELRYSHSEHTSEFCCSETQSIIDSFIIGNQFCALVWATPSCAQGGDVALGILQVQGSSLPLVLAEEGCYEVPGTNSQAPASAVLYFDTKNLSSE